ncbi:putative kinase C-like, phorbol ester/diacylglycerol-binding protein [Helianthus annuus]|nr:putative kinase C-like, phorbol ester/diacylglycerol-binding protein [Helianthus annuus]
MCDFYVDINCAFIPEEITHEAHPDHLLLRVKTSPSNEMRLSCKACDDHSSPRWGFQCPSCNFYIHVECALLLPKVIKHKCDKHPLSLRYHPAENHISDYFCEICEYALNPWIWFYHCTTCAQSMHVGCVPYILQCEQGKYPWKRDVNRFLNIKFEECLRSKVTHTAWLLLKGLRVMESALSVIDNWNSI